MKTSSAKKILRDLRSYDRTRSRRIERLEAALEQTLADLRQLGGAPKRRRGKRT